MINLLQRFSALSITVILLVGAFMIFSVRLALRTNIRPGVEVRTDAVRSEARVYRNTFGIPHIIAGTSDDCLFALGFTHAQDRLWQMDLMRRMARGKTARIFGSSTLDADRFFRTLGIADIAQASQQSISSESRRALERYAAGVNAFISENKDDLPFEFDALNYAPEPWTVSDCICIQKLMAFDMSMSFWTDLSIGEIADSLGVDQALDFIPHYPASAPTVCDAGSGATKDTTIHTSSTLSTEATHASRSLAIAMRNVRRQLRMTGMCSGSNSWVMTKHERGKKGVILANDPHLALGLPPRWYQVHLTCPEYNAVGCSIPGIPGIVSGRNDVIAWGITNVMLDDCDYFFEKIDSKDASVYIGANGERKKFRYIRDTIEVKSGSRVDSVFYDHRATDMSPVISDATITKRPDSLFHYPASDRAFAHRYALTIAWTARERSDEFLSALRLLKCTSWRDFCSALSSWGAPALNFSYADINGNMGIAPSGYIPNRGAGNANFPHPGWESQYKWNGVIKGAEWPRIYNPSSRFVASANNMTSRHAPVYLSSLWEPPSRAERIAEMLHEYEDYTARDAQYMQLDLISPNARFVIRHVLPVLVRDSLSFSVEQRRGIRMLAGWDYSMSGIDATPALYTSLHERLMKNIFEYRISHDMYLRYAFEGGIPVRKVNEVLADTNASWFGTDPGFARSRRESCIRRSYRDAWQQLLRLLGDQSNWQYGRLHKLTLKHPFHDVTAFRDIVSRNLQNIGGDATTVNNALWQVHNPFDVYVGASMRLVADMEDSVVYSVVPGGSSGQPMDAHYTDQIELWANGGYIPLPMSRSPSSGFSLFTTITPR